MNFLELVMKRQSVRKYSNIPVEREKLLRCLEAARLAPSASNSQPWKWIVVDDTSLRSQIAAETWNQIVNFNKFVNEATVLVVLVMEKPKLVTKIGMAIKKKEWPWIDIGIAAEHFCLQAAEDGPGNLYAGMVQRKTHKKTAFYPRIQNHRTDYIGWLSAGRIQIEGKNTEGL
jgi:nitroreductase